MIVKELKTRVWEALTRKHAGFRLVAEIPNKEAYLFARQWFLIDGILSFYYELEVLEQAYIDASRRSKDGNQYQSVIHFWDERKRLENEVVIVLNFINEDAIARMESLFEEMNSD